MCVDLKELVCSLTFLASSSNVGASHAPLFAAAGVVQGLRMHCCRGVRPVRQLHAALGHEQQGALHSHLLPVLGRLLLYHQRSVLQSAGCAWVGRRLRDRLERNRGREEGRGRATAQEGNARDWASESRGTREFVAQLHAPRSSALMHAGSCQFVAPVLPCHALCLPRFDLL